MIYFESDQHFAHRNILSYCERPFSCVEEMEEGLIANHNSVVSKDDITYHVGDFSFDVKRIKDILEAMNGKHILIPGNHDWCHPDNNRYRDYRSKQYLDYGFKEVMLSARVDEFVLCHFPDIIEPEHTTKKDRFAAYRPNAKADQLVIVGHVHKLFKTKNNYINVGVDVREYKPVSIEEIREELKVF